MMTTPMIVMFLTLYSVMFGFEPGVVPAVCSVESDFRNVVNKNDGGSPSYGICQIKLATARMIKKDVTEEELMNPMINGVLAAAYLAKHKAKYGDNLRCILSAYNAGRCIKSNQETYVNKVIKRMKKYNKVEFPKAPGGRSNNL